MFTFWYSYSFGQALSVDINIDHLVALTFDTVKLTDSHGAWFFLYYCFSSMLQKSTSSSPQVDGFNVGTKDVSFLSELFPMFNTCIMGRFSFSLYMAYSPIIPDGYPLQQTGFILQCVYVCILKISWTLNNLILNCPFTSYQLLVWQGSQNDQFGNTSVSRDN